MFHCYPSQRGVYTAGERQLRKTQRALFTLRENSRPNSIPVIIKKRAKEPNVATNSNVMTEEVLVSSTCNCLLKAPSVHSWDSTLCAQAWKELLRGAGPARQAYPSVLPHWSCLRFSWECWSGRTSCLQWACYPECSSWLPWDPCFCLECSRASRRWGLDLHFSPQTTLLPPVLHQALLCQDTGRLGKGPTTKDILGKRLGEKEESSGI